MRVAVPGFIRRIGSRDALLALAVAALLAGAWLLVSDRSQGGLAPIGRYYAYILAYSYAILLIPPILKGGRLASAFALLAALPLTLALTADLTTLRFFGAPLLKMYPYLPVTAGNASLAGLAGYAASYVPGIVWALAVVTIGLALAVSRLVRDRGQARTTILLALALLYVGASLWAAASARLDPRISALAAEPEAPLGHLHAADRSNNFALPAGPSAAPSTILLIVMESTGADTPASDGKRLLNENIVDQSGTGGWIVFPGAVTNSNASDISVPSILTGSGAHEPIEKMHALPFPSQYAKARGYRTALITSSTLRWAGFEPFLAEAGFGRVVTGDGSGKPFINDLTVDDHFTWSTTAEALKAPGKLFLTLYPQALHWPFQTESAFPIPATIKGRRERAAYIVESGFRLLFDTLRKTGRLDDTLIVVTGDHGEFDFTDTLRPPRMRVDTFDDGILSPIFMVKAPASLPAAQLQALQTNARGLVANLDIAPTFADLFGTELKNGLTYAGRSLLEPISQDRVVYSTATNSWRHWNTAAVAVSRGRERMTCDQVRQCRLATANGAKLSYLREAAPQDDLFKLASRQPVMRQALGQIYRGY